MARWPYAGAGPPSWGLPLVAALWAAVPPDEAEDGAAEAGEAEAEAEAEAGARGEIGTLTQTQSDVGAAAGAEVAAAERLSVSVDVTGGLAEAGEPPRSWPACGGWPVPNFW
jgi:hypothetical protein